MSVSDFGYSLTDHQSPMFKNMGHPYRDGINYGASFAELRTKATPVYGVSDERPPTA